MAFLVIGGILAMFIVFFLIKKLIKLVFYSTLLLISTLIVGYFLFSGEEPVANQVLPEQEQQRLKELKSNAKEKLKERTEELKHSAVEKAEKGVQVVVEETKKKIAEQLNPDAKTEPNSVEKPAKENDASTDPSLDEETAPSE